MDSSLSELAQRLEERGKNKQPLLSDDAAVLDAWWEYHQDLDFEDLANLSKAIRCALYSALFSTPEFDQVERDRLAVQAVDRFKTLYGGSGCSPNHRLDLAWSLRYLTGYEPRPDRRYEIAQEISALHDIKEEPEVRIELAAALYNAAAIEPRPERRYEIAQEISALHDVAQEPEVRIQLANALYYATAIEPRPERRYEIAQEISALHDVAQEPEVRIQLATALFNATVDEPSPERRHEIAQEISALHDIAQEPEVRIQLANALVKVTVFEPRPEHIYEIAQEISALHDMERDPEVRAALAQALTNATAIEPRPELCYKISQEISALHDIAQELEVRIPLAQALLNSTAVEPRPERRYEIAEEIYALHNIKQESEVRITLANALVACIITDSRVIAQRAYQLLVGLAKKFGTEGICAPLAVTFWQVTKWNTDARIWRAAFDYGTRTLESEPDTKLLSAIQRAIASSISHLDFSYVRDRLGGLLTSSLTKFIASPTDQALFGTTESEIQIFEQAVSLLAGHSSGTRAAHMFLQQFRGVSAWKRDYTGGATDAKAVLSEIVRDNVELDSGTLVLEYVVAADKTFLFTSGRTGIESYELTVVGKSIGREKSEDNSHLNWEEHLESKQFAQLHLLPIQVQQEIQRHRRVVICAFGELSTFSFASLPALKDKLICHAYSMSDHIRLRKQRMPSKVGPKVMSFCAGDDRREHESLLNAISAGADPTPFSTKVKVGIVKSVERFKELFPGSKVLGHYESTPEAFASAYMASPPPGFFVYLGHNDVVQGHPFLRLVNEDGDEQLFFTENLRPSKERIPVGLFNACKGTQGGASVEAHNSSGYRFILSRCRTAIVTTISVNFGALNHFVVPFLLEQLATGVTAEYALFNLRKAYESGKLLADYQSEETTELDESKLKEAVYAFVLFGDPEGKL